MSTVPTTPHTFADPFITEGGTAIPEPTVAYRSWGTLNEARDNAVLVCHALTGNTQADEWFGGLFGAGQTLDPDRHYIICPNVLGSCYGTSGPTSINPASGTPYRAHFPRITVRDMVRMHQQLLDALEVRGLELVIGGSLGGMQALEFCIMDDRPQAGIFIGMGQAHSPWAIGISHTQRQAIYTDPHWNDGHYPADRPPSRGLATARMIAMNSYRSPEDFEAKFGRAPQPDSEQWQVESYLSYQGRKLADRFDAVSYVRLTQAMDTHDVARGRGSAAEALGNVRIPTLAVGIDSDRLYPPAEAQALAGLLPNGRYRTINSPHGHDAFLIEFEQMNTLFNTFLPSSPQKEAL